MNQPTKTEIILKKLRQLDVTGYEQKVVALSQDNEDVFEFIILACNGGIFDRFTIEEARNRIVAMIEAKSTKQILFDTAKELAAVAVVINRNSIDYHQGGYIEDAEKIRISVIDKRSESENIARTLELCRKLGFKEAMPIYDKLHDTYVMNRIYFNKMVYLVEKLMSDDHYKECKCVHDKVEMLLESNNFDEAHDKWYQRKIRR